MIFRSLCSCWPGRDRPPWDDLGVAGWKRLSREELIALLSAQSKLIEEQTPLIEELRVEVAELRRQVGRNSELLGGVG